MDVREKLALTVCKATQKTNYKCELNCEKKGTCAYCLVMAEQMIAHGVTVQDNTEISDELLERLRKAPVTVMTEEPTVEVVQEWISVKDRLPEDGEIVLVCGSRGGVYTAVLNKPGQYKGWHKLNSKSHYCDPTHWMPLPDAPQPPKGE